VSPYHNIQIKLRRGDKTRAKTVFCSVCVEAEWGGVVVVRVLGTCAFQNKRLAVRIILF
jgi:hypothetical protein